MKDFSQIIQSLKISNDPLVYAPDEDTFILARIAYNLAKGTVLEIGAGSGYTSIILAKKGLKVTCSDINKNAIELIKKNTKNNDVKLNIIESNLFKNIKKSYDTILFNPPYLPNSLLDQSDPFVKSVDGGKKGYEITKKFIEQIYPHLNNQAIIIFSSLTNLDLICKFITENKMHYQLLEEKKVGLMEKLYVLKFEKFKEIQELEKTITDIKFFTKGKRGFIFKGKLKNKKVGIKIKNPKSEVDTIENEVTVLQELNKHNIGPKIVKFSKNYFVYEFVNGKTIEEFLKESKNIIPIVKKIFKQLRKLDLLKYNKEEMTNPYKHIIVNKNITLLDFERCKKSPKPQNITQFVNYINKFLNKDKEILTNLSRKYKNDYSEKTYKELLNYLTS